MQLTPQQHADAMLARWQELRGLRPDDRFKILMEDFGRPPLSHDTKYEDTLKKISEVMCDE